MNSWRERHHALPLWTLAAVVFVAEGDAGPVVGDQTLIGDGDAVGVAREIGEHGFGAVERRKGMQEKAEQGIWPTKTPLGYRNITGPDGRKIIATEPASVRKKRWVVYAKAGLLGQIVDVVLRHQHLDAVHFSEECDSRDSTTPSFGKCISTSSSSTVTNP
jgi:hypothetical protein